MRAFCHSLISVTLWIARRAHFGAIAVPVSTNSKDAAMSSLLLTQRLPGSRKDRQYVPSSRPLGCAGVGGTKNLKHGDVHGGRSCGDGVAFTIAHLDSGMEGWGIEYRARGPAGW